jgi:hypothetical protein
VPKTRYYVRCSHLDAVAFRRLELDVLALLDWKLNVVTTYHLVEAYVSYGILFSEDTGIEETTKRYVRKYSEFLAELTLHQYNFRKYSAGQLAAC